MPIRDNDFYMRNYLTPVNTTAQSSYPALMINAIKSSLFHGVAVVVLRYQYAPSQMHPKTANWLLVPLNQSVPPTLINELQVFNVGSFILFNWRTGDWWSPCFEIERADFNDIIRYKSIGNVDAFGAGVHLASDLQPAPKAYDIPGPPKMASWQTKTTVGTQKATTKQQQPKQQKPKSADAKNKLQKLKLMLLKRKKMKLQAIK